MNVFMQDTRKIRNGRVNHSGGCIILESKHKKCYNEGQCRKRYGNISEYCDGWRCWMRYDGREYDECPCVVDIDFIQGQRMGMLETHYRMP